MESDWLHEADGRATLTLHIQPGAKKTEVVGLHGDALKIRLAAPPVDGKANQALIGFIAERLKVTTIATLNHRDFTVVRPAHCEAFELLP